MARQLACLVRWAVTAGLLAWVVLACHLAWSAGVLPARFAQQAVEAPPTTLPLRLVGVVVDPETPSNSACLVQCTYREGALARFQVGQRACELAQIDQIRSNAVLITNLVTSRAELLAFSDSAPTTGSAVPPPEAPSITTSSDTVAVGITRGSVDYYLANLGDILAAATATPRFRDDPDGRVMEGFELSKIKQGSIVEQLGLRDGDVLVDVNGQALDGMATVVRLLGQLQTTAQMKMTVLRNGQKLAFVLNAR